MAQRIQMHIKNEKSTENSNTFTVTAKEDAIKPIKTMLIQTDTQTMWNDQTPHNSSMNIKFILNQGSKNYLNKTIYQSFFGSDIKSNCVQFLASLLKFSRLEWATLYDFFGNFKMEFCSKIKNT